MTSFDELRAFLAADMAEVDRVIRQRLHSDVVLINQVGEYIIGGGGKRLRPALLLLAAGACGYQGPHRFELAAVVEFIHTATLLHDDVVDGSDLRRGKNTANQMFGNPAAVLVGDFLYSRSFQMMVSVDSMRVLEVLAEATNIIAEGEVMQLLNCQDPDTDEARYFEVIRYKTAKLFEAASRLGAILGGSSVEVEASLATFGQHAGVAFQLVDDVLDYSGNHEETGKNVGTDLAEGKPTLPLIHVMRNGTEAQRALVRTAIAEGGGDIAEVLDAIRATGALEYCLMQARNEKDKALACLSVVDDGAFREQLVKFVSFAVDRSF